MVDINYSGLWSHDSRCYEQLKAMDDICYSRVVSSRLWMHWIAQHCGWYEWLRIPWAQATKWYEQLKDVDDMNDSTSWNQVCAWHEIRQVMSSRLQILCTTQGCGWHEPLQVMSLGSSYYEKLRVMNDSRSHEFRSQDVMNTLLLRMIWTT